MYRQLHYGAEKYEILENYSSVMQTNILIKRMQIFEVHHNKISSLVES